MDDEERKIFQFFPYRESNPGRLGENQESLPLDHMGVKHMLHGRNPIIIEIMSPPAITSGLLFWAAVFIDD